MSQVVLFKTYPISLTAGVEYSLNVRGTMFAVASNTDPFDITFDESNKFVGVTTGIGAEFINQYEKQVIVSATTQTVVVVLGFGKFNDARASVNAVLNVTAAPSNTFDNLPDVNVLSAAATLIRAADAAAKEVIVHVPSSAANSIRVGSAAVATNTGIEMEPGMSRTFAAENAIYGIGVGGDVIVSAIKLTRP